MRVSMIPSTDPAHYSFVHRIRTRFAETDAMGVVHHGAYDLYLEEARVELLGAIGFPYDQVRSEGIDLVVLELFIQYRQPLHFADNVDIWVRSGALTRTTFQMAYLLQVDGSTRSTAVTVHGAVASGGRPVRLPSFLSQFVATAER